jgi:hypothetical protein
MVCGCCGAAGRNARGCSCKGNKGGKGHSCQKSILKPVSEKHLEASEVRTNKVVSNRQICPLVLGPSPRTDDIWSIGAINADASDRKAIVRSWKAFGNNLSDYVSIKKDGLKYPAILCISELSTIKGAQLFLNRLNQNNYGLRYGHVMRPLINKEHISVYWNENLWTKTAIKNNIEGESEGGYIVSSIGRYMATCLQTKGANPVKLLLFAVHMPHKSGRENARNLLNKAVVELAQVNNAQAVAIVGDFNIQFNTNKHDFFPDLIALFFQRPTTENGRRIDNVLVNPYLAGYVENYTKDIYNKCNFFCHFPIHVHR